MKLTRFIIDMGRVVAYYPGLKKLTGSTTATILLCQLLYWASKSKPDAWTWKTSDELEEETGLTYYEQKTAREILVEKKFLEEEYKRLDHTIRFRVNQDEVNNQWEMLEGVASEEVEQKPAEKSPKLVPTPAPLPEMSKEPAREVTFSEFLHSKDGDLVDGVINASNSPGIIKMREKSKMRDKIEKVLQVIAENKKWEAFIDFAYNREKVNHESLDRFLGYAIEQGFNPIYWTPEKMKTLWPQAFIGTEQSAIKEDFVQKLPEVIEETYAPMPKNLGRNKELD